MASRAPVTPQVHLPAGGGRLSNLGLRPAPRALPAGATFKDIGNAWDKATAERFKTMLLATGNETDRIEAYRAFRGRDPDVSALLKRRGFPTN